MSENAQNIAFFTRFVGAESAGLSKKKGSKQSQDKVQRKVQKKSNKQLKGIEKESNINPNCCTMLLVFSDIW